FDCASAAFKMSSDITSPLFLHPFDGPGSLAVQEKLTGAQNYHSWRRAVEIVLSTKRKLGFIRDLKSVRKEKSIVTLPLPSVETACALLQQEESQREVFGNSQSLMELTDLYSKADNKEMCAISGYNWHPSDKCWEKICYPPWHYNSKQSQWKNKGKNVAKQGTNQPKRTDAVASTESSGHIMFTSKQFKPVF
ncbi:serine carboxypeptidase S28 family protein, partial [Tanacetum coccineum]